MSRGRRISDLWWADGDEDYTVTGEFAPGVGATRLDPAEDGEWEVLEVRADPSGELRPDLLDAAQGDDDLRDRAAQAFEDDLRGAAEDRWEALRE